MHTLTYSRKTCKSRFSWQSILSSLLLFVCLGASHAATAQTFSDEAVSFKLGTTAGDKSYAGKSTNSPYTAYTKLGTTATSPVTPVPSLGNYDLTAGSVLKLTGSSIVALPPLDFSKFPTITQNGNVTAARVLYRVYLSGTTNTPQYTPVELSSAQAATAAPRTFTVTSDIDLLNGLQSGGDYIVDVIFQIDTQVYGSSNTTTTNDPSSSYQATFNVKSPDVTPTGATTTWQSTTSTDWAIAANWTNGVPTATSDAIIPAKTSSNNLSYPILSDPTYNYSVRNLTLQGNSASTVGLLNVGLATLSIYGDLSGAAGIAANQSNAPGVTNQTAKSTQNSTIIFAGANQVITNQLVASDIIIAGSGVKSIVGTLNPTNIIAFRPNVVSQGVIVQSAVLDNSSGTVEPVFNTLGSSYIQISSISRISSVPGEAETNFSYISGVTRADRTLVVNTQNSFGNIGLDVTANHSASSVYAYRVIGDPLFGPTSTSTAHPTKRYYRLVGDDNSESAAFGNSSIDIVFHYLDSEDELFGIKEENLTLYRTKTQGAPYEPLPGTLNQVNNTVVRAGISSLSDVKFTLGDVTNPLPVSLVAFTAIRSGSNTLLNWTTASEKNNTGFEVQVSTDGAEFRKIAFVATQDGNSSKKLVYTYADTEIGKTGVRYYRLRQVDTDETEAFSPVRAVSFSGVASVATALAGYPNPFTNKLNFNLDATAVGNGVAHIQLVDMTGRIVREQDLKVANASLTLTDLDGLRSGLYLAKVTLPDGTVQKVRVQKQ